jgi:type I restriction enzyme M protein
MWNDRAAFEPHLKRAFKGARVDMPANVLKAVLMAFSERDETAQVCRDAKGNAEPDPELRDYENVPLKEDVDAYFEREVKPHVPDAWIVEKSRQKIGYEIPLTRHFYVYTPPRPLEEIDCDLAVLGTDVQRLLAEVMA